MSLDSLTREDELMSRQHRKLSSVVVLNPNMPRSKTEKKSQVHFLDRFLHVSMQSHDPVWLAQTAFTVFAGERDAAIKWRVAFGGQGGE